MEAAGSSTAPDRACADRSCMSVQTLALRECMLANRAYYSPLLDEEDAELARQQEEQAQEEEVARRISQERQVTASTAAEAAGAAETPGAESEPREAEQQRAAGGP